MSVTEPPVEVDTVRLVYQAAGPGDRTGASAQVVQLDEPGEGWRYSAPLRVGGFVSWGVAGMAAVELSVPKASAGHNVYGLRLAEAVDVAREAFAEAVERVPAVDGFEACRVNRIDLVRDFEGVTRQMETLRAFSTVKPSGRAVSRLFQDASRGGAPTLTVGNGARHGTLYDKQAECRGQGETAQVISLAEGRLRFEARLRKYQLRRAGVGQVLDLEEHKLGSMRRRVFEWVGYDREVTGMAKILSHVFNHDGLSRRERLSAIGFFVATAHGQPADDIVSKNTATKYRRIADELGLILDPGGADLGIALLRLDYDRGREVIEYRRAG